MMKRTFTYSMQWSDLSEHSPSRNGQFPDIVVLPDDESVDLDSNAIQRIADNSGETRAGYVQIHDNVRVRLSFWGDDGTRRFGRMGGKMEVLCPRGSEFRFYARCPFCCAITGEIGEDDLDRSHRAPGQYHPECKKQIDQTKEWYDDSDHNIEFLRNEYD